MIADTASKFTVKVKPTKKSVELFTAKKTPSSPSQRQHQSQQPAGNGTYHKRESRDGPQKPDGRGDSRSRGGGRGRGGGGGVRGRGRGGGGRGGRQWQDSKYGDRDEYH